AGDVENVTRRGVRSGRETVVVAVAQTRNANSMAGFAGSKAVRGAVVRNRVQRRLRAMGNGLLLDGPAGTGVVVRAPLADAPASFQDLRTDVTSALNSALRKASA